MFLPILSFELLIVVTKRLCSVAFVGKEDEVCTLIFNVWRSCKSKKAYLKFYIATLTFTCQV